MNHLFLSTSERPQAARKTWLGVTVSMIVAMLLGTAFSVLASSPAQAACGKEGIHLGQPYLVGHEVRAMSFMDSTCAPSQRVQVILERKGCCTNWVYIKQTTLSVDISPLIRFNCTGSTFTYRQRVTASTIGGSSFTVKSQEARLTC